MLARCRSAPPMQRNWTRHWMKPVEWSQAVWSQQTQTSVHTSRNRSIRIRRALASRTGRTRQTTDERYPLNGHLGVVPRLKSRKSFIKINALSQPKRRRNLLAWSYGENDSSHWTPVCTLTSVLTNTFQLAQIKPRQPGRHSTTCAHMLAGQEWTCQSGDIQRKQTLVTVASGRPCNIILVCPIMNTACSTQDLTIANGIAIDSARHWEGTILLKCDWWKDKNDDVFNPIWRT